MARAVRLAQFPVGVQYTGGGILDPGKCFAVHEKVLFNVVTIIALH
jgi:hypothetical protein